jgi:hypothetical protein
MAQYDGRAVIPIDEVRRDYFSHLDLPKFLRKLSSAEIPLPVIHIEKSQKAARGVHVHDLAEYIDARRAAAKKELSQMLR